MTLSQIAQLAAEHQLLLIRMVQLPLVEQGVELEKQRLREWQAAGHAGEMQYMKRDPEIFFDFEQFLPNAKTILSFSVPYSNAVIGDTPSGYGRVARYAWGKDYHKVLKKRMTAFSASLKSILPAANTRTFTDAVPLLERFIAQNSGKGFIGKNTLHIIPSIGSFTFLCEVLIDVEFEDTRSGDNTSSAGCKSCSRCLDNCPTNAFPEPFVLDASRCISYLTIEYKGSFSHWQEAALGDWLFGCDVCQEVCPFNHKGLKEIKDSLLVPANGNGPFLELRSILEIENEKAFLNRFAGTPLMRAGFSGLTRNACAVVLNRKDLSMIPHLLNLLKSENTIVTNAAVSALDGLVVSSTGVERRRIEQALDSFKRSKQTTCD